MNREELEELLQLYKSKDLNVISKANQIKVLRVAQEDPAISTKKIQLRIKLDSFSPVYEDFWDRKYREKIDLKAFDDTLSQTNKKEKVVYSFSDHKMDTQNILASTADSSTILRKENDEIVMEFEVDEKNEKAVKIYDLIESGTIKSNSFIFEPLEISVKEFKKHESDVDYEVTIEKGNLLSIDPVVFAFYPQNEMSLRNQNKLELKQKPHIKEKKNMQELLLKNLITLYEKRNVEFKKEELEKKTDEELLTLYEEERTADLKEMVLATVKDEVAQRAAIEKIENSKEVTVAEMREALHKDTLLSEIKKLNEKKDAKKELSFKDSAKLFLYGNFYLDKNGKRELANETLKTRNVELMSNLSPAELAFMEIKFDPQTREYTGATNDGGLMVIPTFTDSNEIGEELYVVPEVEGAQSIGIIGEAETKIPVSINVDGAAQFINKGDASISVDVNTITTLMKPAILSEHFGYNSRLLEHVNKLASGTTNLMNRQRTALRQHFADKLLVHIGQTFDSVKYNYAGGATADAVIQSTNVGTLAMGDLDKLTDSPLSRYGDIAKNLFVIYTNTPNWAAVKELARANPNDITVKVDFDKMTINGIKVIIFDGFNEKIATGDFPFVLYKKSDVRVYGGTTVVRDSMEAEWKNRQDVRQITHYGEFFLCDPKYNTRVLKIS